jgi:hypothetical protein
MVTKTLDPSNWLVKNLISEFSLKVMISRNRIILADDHVSLRAGVKRIMRDHPELTLIGEAADGLELLQLLK